MKITSTIAKQVLSGAYLYSGYIFVTTEIEVNSGSIADVVVISRNYITTEIEIKIDKQDLKRELNVIECSYSKNKPLHNHTAKWFKHSHYLGIYNKYQEIPVNGIFPNKYCFAVTTDLVDTAVKGVENTPYGVIELDTYKCYDKSDVSFRDIIKPKFIHRKKLFTIKEDEQKVLGKLLTHLCFTNYSLRTK